MVAEVSHDEPVPERTRETKAKSQMLLFYDNLERLVKRYRPDTYAPYMAERLRECLTTPKLFAQTPPHVILRSIEANCAYHKPGYDEPVDLGVMARVMNFYHDHIDPLQLGTVHESLDRLFLVMYREQMELQIGVSRSHLAGIWQLFAADNPIPETAKAFEACYGLSIDQWIQLCFLSHTLVQDGAGDWSVEPLVKWPGYKGTADTVQAFLSYSSRSAQEVGMQFRNVRKELHPIYHSLIRSCFLETPLLRLAGTRIIAPHPRLVLRHAQDGLYRLAHSLPSFDQEFSRSFERYVRTILSSCQSIEKLLDERDLKRVCRGRNCDFLLETVDSLLLVECKACAYTVNLFTDDAIERNNSTKKVADGLTQVYHVAKDVENGILEPLGVDCRKPVMGIIVTFGDIPSANSDWYFEKFFLRRASPKLSPSLYPSVCMTRRPIVLSADVLQQFVVALNSHQVSPLTLYEEKEAEDYHIAGDWAPYLEKKMANRAVNERRLSFVMDHIHRFLESLGVESA